ncbi:porin [Paludibacterium yongneupense]|uniref:porin n=1 Tax=Paludibacterium yongneupense TaxID=400061 RepID=UPI0003FDAE37|nr:porin [Paludibacterium yongneupense]
MNKKIIAVALATSFAAPLAMADVTLYGFLSAGLESVKADGASASTSLSSRTRVSDYNSRIGFKGSEDLGNGLQSIWQVESSLKNFEQGGTNDKGESATFATRNTFVGLTSNSFGTVQMGLYDSVYKRLTTTAVGTNVMADTTADTNVSNGVVTRGDARLKNSVHYTSPTWNGLQGGVSWGADEARTSGTNAQRVSVAGSYTNGGLIVALGYDHQGDTTNTITSATSGEKIAQNVAGAKTNYTKLAAAYKFAFGTYLGAQFEHASYGQASATSMTQNDWTVAVAQDIGAGSVKLSYNKLGNLNNPTYGSPSDYSAKQWVLGGTYNLSKRTQLLAYYTKLTNGNLQNADFGQDALYTTAYNSSTSTAASLATHTTLTAFGAGLKVAF